MLLEDFVNKYDQSMFDLCEKYEVEDMGELMAEKLCSYYSENSNIAKPAKNTLNAAKFLLNIHPTSSLILSAVAIDVSLKTTLLKPIFYGLVHTKTIAMFLTDLTVSHSGMDRYRNLFFKILYERSNINFEVFKRSGSTSLLWEEIVIVQKTRNRIMHNAESATSEDSQLAICVASTLIEKILPQLLNEMGFHLHDDYRICDDWKCCHA